MLTNLSQVSPERLNELTCFDCDARDVDVANLPGKADFCFIDGEHTDAAAMTDFEFFLRACQPHAVIAFHDDYAVGERFEM